jgi:arylsulfatase A
MSVEMYDIKNDIGEQKNLAKERPKLTEELRTRLHELRKDIGAQMPTANPKYDPTKAEYTPPKKNKKT